MVGDFSFGRQHPFSQVHPGRRIKTVQAVP